MLQQATEDLTRALTDMSSDATYDAFDPYSSFFDTNNMLIADDTAKYLWDVDPGILSEQKARGADSVNSISANAPPIFSMTSSDAFAELSNSLNNMVNQFTTETTKAANAAANAARDSVNNLKAPNVDFNVPTFKSPDLNVPNFNAPPLPKGSMPSFNNNPLFESASKAAGDVSTQLQKSLQGAGNAAKTAISSGAANFAPNLVTTTTTTSSDSITATQFAASQGFSQDIRGVMEMIVATILSLPRALMDQAMLDYAPGYLDDLNTDVRMGFVYPLLLPLQEFASQEPLQQAQSIVKVLQLLLSVMIAVPRALLESVTGVTASEFLGNIQQLEVSDVMKGFLSFCGAVVAVIATLLKFVVSITSTLLGVAAANAVTIDGVASESVSTEDILSSTATFLADDLLPSVADGFVLLIQHHAELQAGSMPGL